MQYTESKKTLWAVLTGLIVCLSPAALGARSIVQELDLVERELPLVELRADVRGPAYERSELPQTETVALAGELDAEDKLLAVRIKKTLRETPPQWNRVPFSPGGTLSFASTAKSGLSTHTFAGGTAGAQSRLPHSHFAAGTGKVRASAAVHHASNYYSIRNGYIPA